MHVGDDSRARLLLAASLCSLFLGATACSRPPGAALPVAGDEDGASAQDAPVPGDAPTPSDADRPHDEGPGAGDTPSDACPIVGFLSTPEGPYCDTRCAQGECGWGCVAPGGPCSADYPCCYGQWCWKDACYTCAWEGMECDPKAFPCCNHDNVCNDGRCEARPCVHDDDCHGRACIAGRCRQHCGNSEAFGCRPDACQYGFECVWVTHTADRRRPVNDPWADYCLPCKRLACEPCDVDDPPWCARMGYGDCLMAADHHGRYFAPACELYHDECPPGWGPVSDWTLRGDWSGGMMPLRVCAPQDGVCPSQRP